MMLNILNPMIIVSITPKGALKLPREIVKHLRDPKHLQVRLNAQGVTLTSVQIQRTADLQAIPTGKQSGSVKT